MTSKDLVSKEETYKRMNAELEQKTASLLKEADSVMRDSHAVNNHNKLSQMQADNNINIWKNDRNNSKDNKTIKKSIIRPTTSKEVTHSKSKVSSNIRSKSSLVSQRFEDVAVPEAEILSDLKGAFASLELNENDLPNQEISEFDGFIDHHTDSILPQAAVDLGSEAQIRFMKAKLRVLQEELEKLSEEYSNKEKETFALTKKLREAQEESTRSSRALAAQQALVEKHRTAAEQANTRADSLSSQLNVLKKELDSIKRSQKQQSSTQSAAEVRLNRALEEVEKYKAELIKVKNSAKESSDIDKKTIEQLRAENKRLEKQKAELLTGFKKQLKLIDILKRQKLHMEAAKLLSFTEEEFLKAIEWSS